MSTAKRKKIQPKDTPQNNPLNALHLPATFWADTLVAASVPHSTNKLMKAKKQNKKGGKRATGAVAEDIIRTTVSYTTGVGEMANVMMKLRGFGNNFSVFVSSLIREDYERTLRLYNVEDTQVDATAREIIAREIKKAHDHSQPGDAKAALLEAILQNAGSPLRVIQGFQPVARTGGGTTSGASRESRPQHNPPMVS